MYKNKWAACFLAIVMVVVCLFVASCSSGKTTSVTTSNKPTTTTTTSTTAKPTTATVTPQAGGKLNIITSSPPVLMPIPDIPAPAAVYLLPCVETLVGLSKDGPVPTKLATSWDLAADGKILTFHLRKGVQFHDGTKFDAAAVKFNLDKEIGFRPEIAAVSSVEVVDDYTVRLNLKNYDSTLLQQLAYVAGMMESPASIQSHDKAWFSTHAVGTGPFTLVSFDSPNSMVFQKFTGYWDTPKPYLDELRYTFIVDPVTAELAFRAGTAQAWDQLLPANLKNIGNTGYKINTSPKTIQAALGDSVNPNSPFSKIQVRQALDYAVDKISAAKTFGYNWEAPNQCAAPSQFGYIPNFQGRDYNTAKAKQLLTEAGYPNGFKTKLTVRNNMDMNMVAAYQANLKAAGIDAEIVAADTPSYRAMNTKGWEGIFINGLGIAGSAAKMMAADAPSATWSVSALATDNFKTALAAARSATGKEAELKANQALVKAVFDDAVIIPWIIDSIMCIYQDTVHIDINVVSLQWWNPGDTWISK
jgi:peptide/nickel transport system substrate-binding protein